MGAFILDIIISQNDNRAVALLIPSKHLPSFSICTITIGSDTEIFDIGSTDRAIGLLVDSSILTVYGNNIKQQGIAI